MIRSKDVTSFLYKNTLVRPQRREGGGLGCPDPSDDGEDGGGGDEDDDTDQDDGRGVVGVGGAEHIHSTY